MTYGTSTTLLIVLKSEVLLLICWLVGVFNAQVLALWCPNCDGLKLGFSSEETHNPSPSVCWNVKQENICHDVNCNCGHHTSEEQRKGAEYKGVRPDRDNTDIPINDVHITNKSQLSTCHVRGRTGVYWLSGVTLMSQFSQSVDVPGGTFDVVQCSIQGYIMTK